MDRDTENRANPWRARLAGMLSGEAPFDIVEAAFLVAGEEYPDLEVERETERIREIGAEAAKRVAGAENPFARLDIIREYLFEELAFHGNAEDYDDPRNSFLNEVLNRRVGIPLTLSILFMEVAREAGFRCRGIGLPGHFIVRTDYESRTILVDPFHGGQVVTEEDCRQLIARSTGRPSLFRREQLEGTVPEAMFIRLLRNLKRTYLAREDYPRTLAIVERLLLVIPDDAREIRDRGILRANLGRTGAAVTDLETYLDMEPEAPDAESVRGRLTRLRRKMPEAR